MADDTSTLTPSSTLRSTLRSKRMILLQISSFALLCLLAWQAFKAVSQQRLVASKVLVEYAELASEEFSRRIMQDIGYHGFYFEINQLKQKMESDTSSFITWVKGRSICIADPQTVTSIPTESGRKIRLASAYFIKDESGLKFTRENCDNHIPHEFISEQLRLFEANFANTTQASTSPYQMLHTVYQGSPISLAIAHENNRSYGYLLDRDLLSEALENSFARKPLLPGSLANGNASNQMIDVSVFDHMGKILVKPRNLYPTNLAAEKHLSTEYGGVFDQYTIKITIDPESLDKLIIGGLPNNNLPLIVLTLLATFIVFISSIYQIHKEKNLNRLRENFIAEVSHELRTPLTQIRMFSEMLSTGKSRNEKERIHYAEIIHRESVRLSHLISNVLSYSKSRSNNGLPTQLVLSKQNISPIIQEAIEEFLPIADMNGSRVEFNLVDCEIAVDGNRLKRIINNLLDNAIKYGPSKQTVRVEIIKNIALNSYRISVIDQAERIPKKDRENIWNAYFRLPNENKKAIAGTGIGLYIVKQLVQELNASIWLSSPTVNEIGNHFIIEWGSQSDDSNSNS